MLNMMLGTIVGGSGTILGPIVGSLLFGVLGDVLRSLPLVNSREAASLVRIGYGSILIVVARRMPRGVVGLPARAGSRRPTSFADRGGSGFVVLKALDDVLLYVEEGGLRIIGANGRWEDKLFNIISG